MAVPVTVNDESAFELPSPIFAPKFTVAAVTARFCPPVIGEAAENEIVPVGVIPFKQDNVVAPLRVTAPV